MDSKYKIRKEQSENPPALNQEDSEPLAKPQEQSDYSKLKELATVHPQKNIGQPGHEHTGLWSRARTEKIELSRPKAESNTLLSQQKIASQPKEYPTENKIASHQGPSDEYFSKNDSKGLPYQKEAPQPQLTDQSNSKRVDNPHNPLAYAKDEKKGYGKYARHKNSEHEGDLTEPGHGRRDKKPTYGHSNNTDRKGPGGYHKSEKFDYKATGEYVRKPESREKKVEKQEQFQEKNLEQEKKDDTLGDKIHHEYRENNRNYKDDRFPAKRYSRGEAYIGREGDYRKTNQGKGGKFYKPVVEYEQVPPKNDESESRTQEAPKRSSRQLDPAILMGSTSSRQGKDKTKNFFSSNVFSILPKNEERD